MVAKAEASDPGDFVLSGEGGAYVRPRVSPGAKNTRLKGLYGEDTVRLAVAAPPAEGKANREVERYLATLIGVPRSAVSVVKGTSGRDKLLFVRGAGTGEVRARLDGSL